MKLLAIFLISLILFSCESKKQKKTIYMSKESEITCFENDEIIMKAKAVGKIEAERIEGGYYELLFTRYTYIDKKTGERTTFFGNCEIKEIK